jgi:RNA polymerase sigma factor (sigma-70 family)
MTARCPELLTAEQERALGEAYQAGDSDAGEQLVLHNWRLVVSLAVRYQRRGVDLEDLVQIGNLGLWHAVQQFRPELGYRFSTYAVWWIRQYIQRGTEDQGRTIRMPAYVYTLLGKARRLGVEDAEPAIVAELVDGGVGTIEALQGPGCQVPLSLSSIVWDSADGENVLLSERLVDEQDVEAEAEEDWLCGAIEELLDCAELTERERYVVQRRFGLGEDRGATLDVLARELRVTRERIRQVETDALYKLRRCPARARLASWLRGGDATQRKALRAAGRG